MSAYRPTKNIDTIVIHCADTPNGAYWSAEDIDDWHGKNSPPFTRNLTVPNASNVSPHLIHIGYQFVIELDGQIKKGRALTETGAHVPRHNKNGIGICLIGFDSFTGDQWAALSALVKSLQTRFKNRLKVVGHRDVDPRRTCPGFDVSKWLSGGMAPPADHTHTYNQR